MEDRDHGNKRLYELVISANVSIVTVSLRSIASYAEQSAVVFLLVLKLTTL